MVRIIMELLVDDKVQHIVEGNLVDERLELARNEGVFGINEKLALQISMLDHRTQDPDSLYGLLRERANDKYPNKDYQIMTYVRRGG